ncbi:sensor histidine kinase [Oceanicola sp. S124]|uniref:sensor histidine kinase n=1 Tax=Oceanicola sp. S124 TaxID=1042378 RepID=UPI0002E74951|nr:cache domain-containing protein [Oceanicola sp. S124]
MTRVRLRLLVLALLPMVVLLPLLLGLTVTRLVHRSDELLIEKVASDLRVAEGYFREIENAQALSVASLGQSQRFAEARGTATALLARERVGLGLDFLVYAPEGLAALAISALEDLAPPPAAGTSAVLALLSPGDLARLGPDLPERARIEIRQTANARQTEQDAELRGMVLVSVHRLGAGQAVLVGGRLLNRNLDIIDTMNSLIYANRSTLDPREGTTTLFLEDVRISTNVRLFEGERALGTRVSEDVWAQVLGEGQPWLDRAFVVNDWYISGYVPLEDVRGDRIGMLYTGFREAPLVAERNRTILILASAFIGVILASVPIFLKLASGVFEPLEQMTETMSQVEAGALDARIGRVSSGDEIGEVARHLDRLLDQVEERDDALRGYAEGLNAEVEARTEELREANRRLEETFAQLVIKEKLASLGEVTAGVAHEINNPVAVIQGNLELLRDGLTPTQREDLRIELELIDGQTARISRIAGKLLTFSRPSEMSDGPTEIQVGEAVDSALLLVGADLRRGGVTVEVSHAAAPAVAMSEGELQQVLVNLFINAVQAMQPGCHLRVGTGPAPGGAEIVVADDGQGMSAEVLAQIFDPFFTTKRARGTGLGLSISRTLVERAGGTIRAESRPGEGTTFFVTLPAGSGGVDNLS